jgi:hypothetical protein
MDGGTYDTLRYIATLKCPVFAMPPPLLQIKPMKPSLFPVSNYDGGGTLKLAFNVT